jgi:hypothetical protein
VTVGTGDDSLQSIVLTGGSEATIFDPDGIQPVLQEPGAPLPEDGS